MTVHFDVPLDPDREMAAVLDGFERAKDPDQPVTGHFAHALYGLIGLEISRNAGRTASPDGVGRFRDAVADALVEQAGAFRVFSGNVYDAALNAANGGWYQACLGRSALQVLLDDFKRAAELVDVDEVEEIDDMLRAAAPETPPLRGTQLPAGLPEHHWWWHLPSGVPDDDPVPEP